MASDPVADAIEILLDQEWGYEPTREQIGAILAANEWMRNRPALLAEEWVAYHRNGRYMDGTSLSIPCPQCRAHAGSPCTTRGGERTLYPHGARKKRFAEHRQS